MNMLWSQTITNNDYNRKDNTGVKRFAITFCNKSANEINNISSNIATPTSRGLPNGIPIKPTMIIEITTINTKTLDFIIIKYLF